MFCGDAMGNYLPPVVVYKAKNIYANWKKDRPKSMNQARKKKFEDKTKRHGLAQVVYTICKSCLHKVSMKTSSKVGRKPYDVNAAVQGMGYAGLKKVCTSLDLPEPVSKKPFNNMCKQLAATVLDKALSSMSRAADRLFKLIEKETEDQIVTLPDGKKVASVAVSVDGTWQKRGHTSRIGVVFILSIDTGEVLDFVLKSLICHECNFGRSKFKGEQLMKWLETHKPNCTINHKGSSDSMETQGAIEMFLCSVERHNLQYTSFIGDGDSNCFGSVKEALQTAEHPYSVEKEESVGHIQKRMGSALRRYKNDMKGKKLADGISIGG